MNTAADVEDDDLETAEDGSTITTEHRETADERARDERGRFVSEADEEEESEEAEEAPAKPAKKPADSEEAAEGDEEEEAAEEEEAPSEKAAKKDTTDGEAEESEESDAAAKPGRFSRRLATLVERNHRLEADLAAERALNARAQQEAKPAKTELDTINERLGGLYEEVEKARSEGDPKLAAKLQREIDEANRRIVVLESAPRARAETAAAVAAQQFNDTLDRVETRFAELNPKSREFDQDAAREVEFQTLAYEKMGMKPKDALHRAILLLYQVDLDDPEPKSRRRAEEEDEREPVTKKPLVKPTKVERNIAAAKRGVPSPDNTAPEIEEGRIDVSKLTDEEFDALPESKLDELGGNVVRAGKRR
jgi:hypothetical protein